MDSPSPPAAPAADPERRVWIGCSGYAYKHWRGKFYPEDLPATRWLDHYVQFFPTVELNNTYYTLPGARTFMAWHDRSPPGFCFAVKASRFITHMKKLKDPAEPLAKLLERTELLGPKLGPISISFHRTGALTPGASSFSSMRCPPPAARHRSPRPKLVKRHLLRCPAAQTGGVLHRQRTAVRGAAMRDGALRLYPLSRRQNDVLL